MRSRTGSRASPELLLQPTEQIRPGLLGPALAGALEALRQPLDDAPGDGRVVFEQLEQRRLVEPQQSGVGQRGDGHGLRGWVQQG